MSRESTKKEKASYLTPLISKLLSEPLSFKEARFPDSVTIKPNSYVKLTSGGSESDSTEAEKAEKQKKMQVTKSEWKKKRPRSVLEAVAMYTGKPAAKTEKRRRRSERRREREIKQLERTIEKEKNAIAEVKTEHKGSKEENNAESVESGKLTMSNAVFDGESEKDADASDADYQTADEEGGESENEESEESENEEDEGSEGSENENGDEEEDMEQLKRDLKRDMYEGAEKAEEDEKDENDVKSEKEEKEQNDVRNTKDAKDVKNLNALNDSNVEIKVNDKKTEGNNENKGNKQTQNHGQTKQINQTNPSDKPPTASTPNSDFFDLDEEEDDRGSNGSKRIFKSWRQFENRSAPVGLLNHGVTCYMNSAVQAMCHVPAVMHYFVDVHRNKYNKVIGAHSVTKVLADTACKMFQIGRKNEWRKVLYINPKKLIYKLEEINPMMSEWQQEDSHEYFMSLMSRLQEDSTPKGVKLNQSIIYDIFGGLLNQTVTCTNCGHISTTQQEFYDLSLGLESSKARESTLLNVEQMKRLKERISASGENGSSRQVCDLLERRIQTQQEQRKINLKGGNGVVGSSLNAEAKLVSSSSSYSSSDQDLSSDGDTDGTNEETYGTDRDADQDTDQDSSSDNDSNANQEPNTSEKLTSKSTSDSNPGSNSSAATSQQAENSVQKQNPSHSIQQHAQLPKYSIDRSIGHGYVCEKCNKRTAAVKISTISRAPETLTVHLKRFRFNGTSSMKVKATVSYPDVLDLSDYTTTRETPVRYRLIAVILHEGRSVSSGHYVAHCRQPDGTWATYDDEIVQKIKPRRALNDPSAYVLIYSRLTLRGVPVVPFAGVPQKRVRGQGTQKRGRRKRRRRN
ncbi:hypothetical protein HII12_004016 [Brettanomyces bruxellensis]|uniref:ubiquitinyl hydrolase 1 n=1 Tax=Dekkera bruxellensis TaxID=5007 RepID=A0A8H6BBU5_DEKBR|nr:hypothetical protein HII12_004016 [Brettanomyces bruxellensis]